VFEDKDGKILTIEEVNNLMYWELDEKKSHTYRENHFFERKLINGGFSKLILNEQDDSAYDIFDEDS
jgi:hypothetical protein